jgi:hypothetical protein
MQLAVEKCLAASSTITTVLILMPPRTFTIHGRVFALYRYLAQVREEHPGTCSPTNLYLVMKMPGG